MERPTQEFIEWTDAACDEDLEAMTDLASRAMWKWIILSFIPIVNIFTAGIAMFCYNNLCFLKSRGHRVGNKGIMFLFLVWGLFLVPLIEYSMFTRDERLGDHILGWI